MLAALNLPKSGSHIVMTLSYRRLMQVCYHPRPHLHYVPEAEQWRGTGCSRARGWCNCSQGELSRKSPVRFSGNMKIKIDSWRAKTQKEGGAPSGWVLLIGCVSAGEDLMFELLFCRLTVPERGCAAGKFTSWFARDHGGNYTTQMLLGWTHV